MNIERYVGEEVGNMESSILQLIREGSSNFRNEIERYLVDVESTSVRLKEDVKLDMEQVAYKLDENDARNAKVDEMLQDLANKTNRTEQLWEQERARREQETKELMEKIESLMKVIEQQQQVFATNQQKIKEECMQEMKDVKAENGRSDYTGTGANFVVPSQGGKLPPGLFDGGDHRGLGVKSNKTTEGIEEKGPRGLYFQKETDSQLADKVGNE